MFRYFQLFFCTILGCTAANAEPQTTKASTPLLVISTERNFAAGTFPPDANWQGLFCKVNDCEIKNARVSVTTSSAKNIVDEDVPLDVVGVDGEPLALFPSASFKAGKATTWYRITDSSYESTQNLNLKLGKWHMPWGTRPLTLSRVKTPEGWMSYHVSDGVTKQFMFRSEAEGHYGGDTTPIIYWAGDLDRDGKLDMLLSIPDDNCGFDERLYLSSNAGEGKVLRKAAQLSGGEAACGC